MRPLLMTALLMLRPWDAPSAAAHDRKETIVLIHGMGRTRASMLVLQSRFKKAGYATLSFPYDQRRPMDELSRSLSAFLERSVQTPRYHIVAHSLGSLIVRDAMRAGLGPALGRIVMLAPPNRPAALARLLKEKRLYRWITGESGQRLADEDFYRTLPVPPVEFAVIAGDQGQRITFSEPNDGIVDVEGTKLPGMKAFAVLRHSHTFLMNAQDTFHLCRRFIEHGDFDVSEDPSGAHGSKASAPSRPFSAPDLP